MMVLDQITLIHPWNQERKTVPILTVTRTYIAVRWDMAGIYELDLKNNVVHARSVSARRKNPSCLWYAENIKEIREAVRIHLRGVDVKAEVIENMTKHAETMPGAKPMNYSRGRG